ncbi:hypothetical protein FXF51_40030 [Nonomuraea sp. PA05]|uniref:hypothetical protein n=1 Tax=Nonomuraea sp. PA05 TaxID=2604466 RepID=UPI0011DA5B7A|nr:hypothetical protein [Nonomuraea sp. PA05]TYB57373.1 hypothetical protein FXF51_40030 [Nonomuraea sp. PA05]
MGGVRLGALQFGLAGDALQRRVDAVLAEGGAGPGEEAAGPQRDAVPFRAPLRNLTGRPLRTFGKFRDALRCRPAVMERVTTHDVREITQGNETDGFQYVTRTVKGTSEEENNLPGSRFIKYRVWMYKDGDDVRLESGLPGLDGRVARTQREHLLPGPEHTGGADARLLRFASCRA